MITISQATWQYTAAERPTMEGVDLVIEPGETRSEEHTSELQSR